MKIEEIIEAQRFSSQETELDYMNNNVEYDGEIDPHISNIMGKTNKEWDLVVGEVPSEHKHGIVLSLTSFYDDGAQWDIDLGSPEITGHSGYESPSRHSPGGYEDVKWERGDSSGISMTQDTDNVTLQGAIPKITKSLEALTTYDDSTIHPIFKPVIAALNNQS